MDENVNYKPKTKFSSQGKAIHMLSKVSCRYDNEGNSAGHNVPHVVANARKNI
jgi:hypothetical protein